MGTQQSFKYVYIPADVSEQIEERVLRIPPGEEVECFLNVVKDHFTRAGGERTKAQRLVQKQALLKHLGQSASQVDASVLDSAVNMQMVENIALLSNSRETGFIGVNMYCDDQAQLKQLPINPRASQVAECCGKLLEVRGDAFLARVFDNEDEFRRMDFTLSEVSSSARWVRDAAEQAQRKREQGGDTSAEDFLDRLNQKKLRPASTAQVCELTPAESEKEAGNVAFKQGNWEEAVVRYSAAVAHEPSMAAAYNNRALARIKLGQHAEAEADCEQVLALEPNNVKALYRRGLAREAQGKPEAARDFGAVLAHEPHNKDAQAALQRCPLPPPPPQQQQQGQQLNPEQDQQQQ